jgi:prepilin-type N-terminal cleavage/methylation domain-containing protein
MALLSQSSPRPRRGFSLLEVMVAVTIMGIVMGALIVTFRTGIRGWRMGHNTSEIFQTARITRDVLLRDLHNLTFRDETEYNRTFRKHFETMMGSQYRQVRERGRTRRSDTDDDQPPSPLEMLDFQSMAPPIDLSFRVDDNGRLDKLTFVRWQRPTTHAPKEVWGLRRLTYFVREQILYRQEKDPFEFRPSGMLHQLSLNNEAYRDLMMQLPSAEADAQHQGRVWGLPDSLRLNVEEPLCEGVEMFDVTLGYFKRGQWQEVPDWDSSARHYRHPPEEEELEQFTELIDRRSNQQTGIFSILMQNEIVQMTDKLPGYLAIQLGLRPSGGQGRLYSYTIFYSIPQAQETDSNPEYDHDRDVYLGDIDFRPPGLREVLE